MASPRPSDSNTNALSRRQLLKVGAAALGGGLLAAGGGQAQRKPSPTLIVAQGSGLDRVSYATNWYAQAEHGGFYQAVATGIYREHGLDVTIKMGGPGINITQVLAGGAAEFAMGGSTGVINAVREGIPLVCVAAIFQKDPQIIMTHPGTQRFEELKGRPIFVSKGGLATYWPYLKARFGFTDDQVRPYNFNPGPFLADPSSAQQGYLTSEPFAIQREGGFEPVVFLLADLGYKPYATTIETRRQLVETKPDLVERFVDASIKGWYSFLEDPRPAYRLIKQDNPEMTDAQLAYSFEKLQEYGIILSGDALEKGIGAMTDKRWQDFFDSMTVAGVFEPTINYRAAYTLDFVNKGTAYYTA
ncbi:ABC transporter substrate-binding protein [Synechococcus sp. R60.3]|uniref:ABC transporter substrate-binding protein n=1 Tax=unclassified Synechococcus TaxID=2626047 RepID=UPI0039C23874